MTEIYISEPPTIKPIGVGDLKVVKQALAKYEAGEVAHMENVLEGETRKREHRRLRQIEETLTIEKIQEEESERDLQSTERFEIQKESQTVMTSETTFEAGLSLSAGYGPIQISANTDFGMVNSKEQSDRTATTYAKEVSEKAVERLTERIREERVARVLEEFEETNLHKFKSSDQRVSGIYRWVDKYYRVVTKDYGLRLFYQFFVPQPAAFYLKAKGVDLATSLPEMPLPPTIEHPDTGELTALSPELIQRDNYLTLVKQYGAQDVEAPPTQNTFVSKSLSREIRHGEGDDYVELALSEEIQVPNGYSANTAYGCCAVYWSTTGGDALFIFGTSDSIHPIPSALPMDFECGSIYVGAKDHLLPISVTGRYIKSFVINIEILCQLNDETFEQWQINTYNVIYAAYQKRFMEFEDRIAAAEVAGATQWGQNPLINREIEKQELKRACIALWSGYETGSNPGIVEGDAESGVGSYPEIDREAAVANIPAMRFFEEAFEWDNMTYEFLPYYWGDKEEWIETYALKSEDPIFEQFLRAGAANIRVPVRPSYSEAVLYYQLSGNLWLGDPDAVPALEDYAASDDEAQLYNDYLGELEGMQDIPEEEQDRLVEISPDDENSFLIKVPTSLIWLQPDNELPNNEPSP